MGICESTTDTGNRVKSNKINNNQNHQTIQAKVQDPPKKREDAGKATNAEVSQPQSHPKEKEKEKEKENEIPIQKQVAEQPAVKPKEEVVKTEEVKIIQQDLIANNEEIETKKLKLMNTLKFMKTHVDKAVSLINTPITEINYSSKRITKFYRDQEPYHGTDLFTDSMFPPNLNSILGLTESGEPVDKDEERRTEAEQSFRINQQDIVWLRPKEIFGPDYALFEGQIEFDDVRQGSIGNCYFMASISALTECPQIIAEIFRVHEVQKNGYYEICLKIDGEWNVIILDDYIPCSNSTKKPIFAKPKGNELWAILLEKAWAKVNGGYINTVAGMASEVIECMTNFPFEYYQTSLATNDEEYKADLWRKILEASDNDYIMTTALPPKQEAKTVGLVDGHEYTLQYGREIEVDGESIKLLKIRNPWGSINYKGKWGPNDSRWTKDLKDAFEYKNVYDGEGEFYISYDDFLFYFGDIDICKIEKRICLLQSKIEYSDPHPYKLFEINLSEPSKLDVTIFKPYYRFKKDLPTYWTLNQQLFLAKVEDLETMNFSRFWGACEGQNDCFLNLDLEPGKYLLYAYVDPQSAKCDNGNLSQEVIESLQTFVNIYSSQFFTMEEKDKDKDMSLLHQMILSYNRNNPPLPQKQIIISSQHNFVNSEFSYLYLKNIYKCRIEFTFDFMNVELKGIFKNLDHYTFTLDTNEDTLFLYTCNDLYLGHGIGYNFKLKKASDDSPAFKLLPDVIPIRESHKKETDLADYLWIYRKSDIDYSKILVKIDATDAAFKHLYSYYPKEVEEIQKVPKLKGQDELQLIVKNKEPFGENDWYIGEWKKSEDNELVMWGRGYLFLQEIRYIGQFVNHSMVGTGCMIKKNGDKIEGNFKDFHPSGKCTLTHNDGKVEVYQY